jgi:GNAT superfamily N-acetyltransferase
MQIKDLPSVIFLCDELGYTVSLEDLNTRFLQIDQSNMHVLEVAEESDGRIVGFIHFSQSFFLTDFVRCEILGMVVTKQERKKGIGRMLVASAEEWAKNQGIGRMRVRSQALRENAHDFYKSLGFELKKIQNVFIKEIPQAKQQPSLSQIQEKTLTI